MPPGIAPLVLFRALARDPRLFQRFMGGGLLDKGHLTLGNAKSSSIASRRETDRNTSGACISPFSPGAGLDERNCAPGARRCGDACWGAEDAPLIRFCDALDGACDIDDALWAELRARFSEEAMLEFPLRGASIAPCPISPTAASAAGTIRSAVPARGSDLPGLYRGGGEWQRRIVICVALPQICSRRWARPQAVL